VSITCCIVDDEPLARERLRALLTQSPVPVTVVGESSNGQEALGQIEQLRPDIVFLDVQMPILDGFDVAEMLREPRPRIVFVTAYDQHALRAFEVRAVDYLTKPVRLARLNATLEHLFAAITRERSEHSSSTPAKLLTRLTVHAGRRRKVVPTDLVSWFEAKDKIVLVHLAEGAYPVDFTLDELERRLDPARFLRLHRSHIVNASTILELAPWFAGSYVVKLSDGSQLPIARRRVREIRALLGGRGPDRKARV
jgi:two-component system LytT family response regulator